MNAFSFALFAGSFGGPDASAAEGAGQGGDPRDRAQTSRHDRTETGRERRASDRAPSSS